ncbi:50S ribosomal protein L29 [candidate division WWE3 bacterium]|nr:50S ribosomal protein L29 [candidate division WWE3 bacterium]
MMLITKDLRSKTTEELKELLIKTKVELGNASSATMQGAQKDKGMASKMRKEVAKIMTVLNEKKILAEVK